VPRLVGSIVLQVSSMREHRLAAIEHSMDESMRFTVTRTIVRPAGGHARCASSFVDQDGAPMTWHDFGCLEGPGWAANAVGGAGEVFLHARLRGNRDQEDLAVSLLDHVLEDGFVDEQSGFVIPYRGTATGAFCLNFKHNDEWLCPGSMARTGCQLLAFADVLPEPRRGRMQRIAARMAEWIRASVPAASNGWYPRRCTRDGRPFPERAEGGPDPLAEGSADGIFTVHLYLELARRGLADHLDEARSRLAAFTRAGGIFGSINHDTYDAHECVSYAAAFRALLPAARLLRDPSLRAFAWERCLPCLDRFQMKEDRNGVRTAGLLVMEESWDTAYLWENAEAALAFLDAAEDGGGDAYRRRAEEILAAVALHHHGRYGFLTEGVDWNNHVGQEHHVNGARFGDIRYTEPLLNNLHITEPTLRLLAGS